MDERLYYITDTYGTIYGLDSTNRLSVVGNEEQATRFTLAKANNVIQNSIKPTQRFQYVIKEAPTQANELIDFTEFKKEDFVKTRFDNMDTEWNEYLNDLISFISQLRQYQVNLNQLQSEVDKEICDIMHYVEFFNLDAAKGYKVYKMLKERRLRRRIIKDESVKVTAVIEALGDQRLLDKLIKCLEQIKALDRREYNPRILHELFENAS